MIVWHKHHIVPKHAGGTDDPSNLLKCNVAMHAFMHEQRYKELGDHYDKIAADCLRGQIGKAEIHSEVVKESNRRRSGETRSEVTKKRMSDAARATGRKPPALARSGKHLRGKPSNSRKLTVEQAKEIKYYLIPSGLSNTKIAEMFDIKDNTISAIRHNRLWKNI